MQIQQLILLGDTNVGKTAMVQRYVKHAFQSENLPTVGIDMCKKKYVSKQKDFEGQEY